MFRRLSLKHRDSVPSSKPHHTQLYADEDGVLKQRASDGTVSAVGAGEDGGSLPSGGTTGQVLAKASNADGDAVWTGAATSREDFVAGAATTIANNGNGRLEWAKIQGSTLLDLTDPSVPVAITSGVYAVSACVVPTTNMTADGFYQVTLELDSDGDQAGVEIESRLATAAKPLPKTALAGTYYVPAGGTFRVKVYNFDGANSIDFGIASAFIQKVS